MGSHGLLLRALQGSVCVYEQIALQGLIHTPHTWVEHKSNFIRPSFVAMDFYYFFVHAVVCDGFFCMFLPKSISLFCAIQELTSIQILNSFELVCVGSIGQLLEHPPDLNVLCSTPVEGYFMSH